ncbi:DUF4156 domain-containing protein [Solilutibacter silvestris]|uniref:DUF4156 domain-containing protein n=1 Tax=Solilutibacter silvestris TaxID=1645665 RepID=A0A2K1Q0W1_9GAMM|nr:DUF4156 domain-containing protein [Lysobacter silvestris]PNS08664.1 hypothetical protein Lysil_0293 [Lysobacter silvestris]
MHRFALTSIAAALVLAGCSLAPMTPEAERVQVVAAAPTGCAPAGRVEVSVTSGFAMVKRNQLRVKDELETLARQEAAKIGANTVSPREAPSADGSQSFEVWRCTR